LQPRNGLAKRGAPRLTVGCLKLGQF
jgi:hypothetical protein